MHNHRSFSLLKGKRIFALLFIVQSFVCKRIRLSFLSQSATCVPTQNWDAPVMKWVCWLNSKVCVRNAILWALSFGAVETLLLPVNVEAWPCPCCSHAATQETVLFPIATDFPHKQNCVSGSHCLRLTKLSHRSSRSHSRRHRRQTKLNCERDWIWRCPEKIVKHLNFFLPSNNLVLLTSIDAFTRSSFHL